MSKSFLSNSLGLPFIKLLSVDSTNNYALTQIHAGLAQHGTAYFAHQQVAGRGQRGKIWTTPKNSSLIVSIVINPQQVLELRQQFELSACVAISVCEFFGRYAGDATRIKWPNDLYWYDRKAGGILIENIIGSSSYEAANTDYKVRGTKPEDDLPRGQLPAANYQPSSKWLWAVAGIGININQPSFPGELKNPISLKQITGQDFDPVKLAKELCFLMDKNFKKLITNGFEDIYASYLCCLYKKNELVQLKKGPRVFEAFIKSVSPTGQLIVQHAVEESFEFGEIEWILTADNEKIM